MHDQDSVAEGLDQGQIVADEQVGERKGFFQMSQQLHNLFLHRDVQSAGGLVADEDAGGEGQGPGDGGSLALAAAELMGILSASFRRKAALL